MKICFGFTVSPHLNRVLQNSRWVPFLNEVDGKSPSLDAGVEAMERTIILLGKVGHGKTHLFNKLCGRSQRSTMIAGTCTREIFDGRSLVWKMRVIDTPGFFGTSNVAETHIQAHRQVIESNDLTGLYLVVKCGAPGDMAECINHLMNFVGSDDVRLIVTHMDVVYPRQTQADVESMILSLSNLVGVSRSRIIGVRKDTNALAIEHFIFRNCHLPRRIRIDEEQLHYATYLTVGARRFNTDIRIAKEKLEAASQIVRLLTTHFGSDLLLAVKTRAVRDEMARFVEGVLRDIECKAEDMPPEVQTALRAKITESIQPMFADLRNINVPYTHQPSRDAPTSTGAYETSAESSNYHSSRERYKKSCNFACEPSFPPRRDYEGSPNPSELNPATSTSLHSSREGHCQIALVSKPSSYDDSCPSTFDTDKIARESLSAEAKRSAPHATANGSGIQRHKRQGPIDCALASSNRTPAEDAVRDRTTVTGAAPATKQVTCHGLNVADSGKVQIASANHGLPICGSGRQEPVCRSVSDVSVATAPQDPSTRVSDKREHQESRHAASNAHRLIGLTRARPLLDVELPPVAEKNSFLSSTGVPSSAYARECIREQSFAGDRFHHRAERDFKPSSLGTATFLGDWRNSSRTALDHGEIGRDAFDVNANRFADFSRYASENSPDASARRLGMAAPTDSSVAPRWDRLTSDSSRHDAKDATSGVLDADLSDSTHSSTRLLNLPLSPSARLSMVTALAERAAEDMTLPMKKMER
jgi:GTP-binding protein EngB required for normal cell division